MFEVTGAATFRVAAAASSTRDVGAGTEATGSMEGFTAGETPGRGETASGTAAGDFAGMAAAGVASTASYRSSVSRISGIDTERHDGEWQCRGASMRTRCRATTNENVWPAYADELSIISTLR